MVQNGTQQSLERQIYLHLEHCSNLIIPNIRAEQEQSSAESTNAVELLQF
jgi:hypothetical protein